MASSANSTLAPSAHTPTRRDLIRAAPIAAVALTLPAAALAASTGDAAIFAAWDRRKAAIAELEALPAKGRSSEEAERQIYAVMDEAEAVIQSTVAHTLAGVQIQLLLCIHTSLDFRDEEKALIDSGFAPEQVFKMDRHLDWHIRMAVAALRSIRAMGA